MLTNKYSVDPSAHVFGNKIYIYAPHDQSGVTSYTYPVDQFDMVDYKVISINESLTAITDPANTLKLDDIPQVKRRLSGGITHPRNVKMCKILPTHPYDK